MAWWAAAAFGLQAAGGLAKLLAGNNAAALQRAETREALRRMQAEFAQRRGMAEAIGSGSGFEYSSESLQRHLTDMSDEFRREADWMRKAGYAKARSMERSAAWGAVGDLGGAMYGFGAANNWWRPEKPPVTDPLAPRSPFGPL